MARTVYVVKELKKEETLDKTKSFFTNSRVTLRSLNREKMRTNESSLDTELCA